jgi:hypothetical protein
MSVEPTEQVHFGFKRLLRQTCREKVSGPEGITKELGVGEVISKSFEVYTKDFLRYWVIFAIVGVVVAVVDRLVTRIVTVPVMPASASFAQLLGYFGATFETFALTLIVGLIFYPIYIGTAVNMASNRITTGAADARGAVRRVLSKIVVVWTTSVISGLAVFVGFLALIVPGMILLIMFSLYLPAILIENAGVLSSLSRSQSLVDKRWLKSLGLFLVAGIIIVVLEIIVNVVVSPIGLAAFVVSAILNALYLPLIPIILTVYYYSNLARLVPLQPNSSLGVGQQVGSGAGAGPTNYCTRCGSKLKPGAIFCEACGQRVT